MGECLEERQSGRAAERPLLAKDREPIHAGSIYDVLLPEPTLAT